MFIALLLGRQPNQQQQQERVAQEKKESNKRASQGWRRVSALGAKIPCMQCAVLLYCVIL